MPVLFPRRFDSRNCWISGRQNKTKKQSYKKKNKKKQRQKIDAKFICTSNLNCTLASTVVVLFSFISISDDYDEHVN